MTLVEVRLAPHFVPGLPRIVAHSRRLAIALRQLARAAREQRRIRETGEALAVSHAQRTRAHYLAWWNTWASRSALLADLCQRGMELQARRAGLCGLQSQQYQDLG